MAGSSLVLTDDSALSRIDQKLYRVEGVLALVSGLAVFSLMILAVVSVSGRNFANQPLPGYIDWIEQAMPLIASWAFRSRSAMAGTSGWTCWSARYAGAAVSGRIDHDPFHSCPDAASGLGKLGAFCPQLRLRGPTLEP